MNTNAATNVATNATTNATTSEASRCPTGSAAAALPGTASATGLNLPELQVQLHRYVAAGDYRAATLLARLLSADTIGAGVTVHRIGPLVYTTHHHDGQTVIGPPLCPHCGSEQLRWFELTRVSWNQLGVDHTVDHSAEHPRPTPKLIVYSDSRDDESPVDRFWLRCGYCDHAFSDAERIDHEFVC